MILLLLVLVVLVVLVLYHSKKLASHTLELTDVMLAYYITSHGTGSGFVKKVAGGNYTITIICIKV